MTIQFDQTGSATTGHSAAVTMTLHIGSVAFPVLQSSNDAIKIMAAENVPAGDAILDTTVDGRLHRRLIRVVGSRPQGNWIDIVDR
jgi:hypothetical protein